MKFAVDTNILLRASVGESSTADSAAALAMRQVQMKGWEPCLCLQNLVEYWAVATRPVSKNGLEQSLDLVREQISRILYVYTLLPDLPETLELWQGLCARYAVSGKQSHDTRLTATILANGVSTILTLNPSDFRRFTELTVLTPDEALIQ